VPSAAAAREVRGSAVISRRYAPLSIRAALVCRLVERTRTMTTTTALASSLPSTRETTPGASPTTTRTTTTTTTTRPGRAARYGGRALSGVAIAFLAFDAAMKIVEHPKVIEASAQLGMSADVARPLGLVLATCAILYAIPRTAVLGAALLTGYLGGAVFAHLRIDDPLFSHVLFPVYLGCFIWGGLLLRDSRVRALVLKGDAR
jgi:hypothetical protein